MGRMYEYRYPYPAGTADRVPFGFTENAPGVLLVRRGGERSRAFTGGGHCWER